MFNLLWISDFHLCTTLFIQYSIDVHALAFLFLEDRGEDVISRTLKNVELIVFTPQNKDFLY